MAMTEWLSPFMKTVLSTLLAAGGVTAIVGTRIRAEAAEGETEPYITITPIPDVSHHGIGFNAPAYVTARVQIMGWARTKVQAIELVGAISVALDGKEISVTGWGTSRLEGYGTSIEDYLPAEGVRHYVGMRRYAAQLPGTNVT